MRVKYIRSQIDWKAAKTTTHRTEREFGNDAHA